MITDYRSESDFDSKKIRKYEKGDKRDEIVGWFVGL